MSEVRSEGFDLPGLRVHALVAGDPAAPPVILLHGFPELSESWRDVLPLVAASGRRAIAPDLRGYGGTDKPKTGYDIETLAGDAAALIHACGGRADVVGHDWGGAIAFELAARHPEVVRTLTIVNAPHPRAMAERVFRPRQLVRSWYMFFFQLPWLPERMLSHHRGERLATLLRRGAVNPVNFTDARMAIYAAAFATPELARPPITYYRQAVRGLFRPRGDYPRIRAPFRLIWGTEDRALGLELTRGLEPYFEGKPDVVYLEGVGHSAPLEAPEKVAAAITQHLGRLPA